jgi:hypothetical protein
MLHDRDEVTRLNHRRARARNPVLDGYADTKAAACCPSSPVTTTGTASEHEAIESPPSDALECRPLLTIFVALESPDLLAVDVTAFFRTQRAR